LPAFYLLQLIFWFFTSQECALIMAKFGTEKLAAKFYFDCWRVDDIRLLQFFFLILNVQ